MDFLQLVKNRYSCKKFCDKKVEGQRLERVMEAGQVAPTAKNAQPQRIFIAKDEQALAKIDELTPCRYGAPIVIVVGYDKTETYTYPGEKHDSGVEDATIVATHMMLAAAAEGLDSCWINFFDPDKAKTVLGIKDDVKIVMFLALGYAADLTGPLQNHYKRKNVIETVKYL